MIWKSLITYYTSWPERHLCRTAIGAHPSWHLWITMVTSKIKTEQASLSSFAMPSNNNRNGHVILSVRKTGSEDENDGDRDVTNDIKVNKSTMQVQSQQQQQQQPLKRNNNNVNKGFPDTVDFGTITSTASDNTITSTPNHYNNKNRNQRSTLHYDHTEAHDMHQPVVPPPSSSPLALKLQQQHQLLIDNRQLSYIPIRLQCGTCVFCAPEVLSTCPMVLQSLQADVTRALKVLPASVHALVRRTKIWVNASYSYGYASDPQVLRHLTTHHEAGWLVECANDRADKAGGIEVYSCWDLEAMRLHWNGSGLLLHELCHLIHQHCLEGGLDHKMVERLYQQAKASGKYENVLRRDWAGMEEDYDLAYAMVDKKEFFAEISVAFLCHGYTHLNKKDCNNMEECCPPLLHPTVMERVLTMHGLVEHSLEDDCNNHCSDVQSCGWSLPWGILRRRPQPKIRMVDPIFAEAATSRCCINVDHCNKFYPFTRGQLQHYDRDVFRGIRDVWKEISMWEDPKNSSRTSWCGI